MNCKFVSPTFLMSVSFIKVIYRSETVISVHFDENQFSDNFSFNFTTLKVCCAYVVLLYFFHADESDVGTTSYGTVHLHGQRVVKYRHHNDEYLQHHGLRRAKAGRAIILLDHSLVRSRRLGHWFRAARFHRRLPSLAGWGRPFCHCESTCMVALCFYCTLTYFALLTCCTYLQRFQLCVPDWPFYNRHPIKWLDSVPDRREHSKSS